MRGRYDLVELMGRGAAGDVYRARDRVCGGREVALKRIRAQVDEPLRSAFEREFSTMASLALPGVAPVYDLGLMADENGDGERLFYTREFIAGVPLDSAAREVAVPERIALFAKVARVIALLHRAGVVHGDIKPGNAIIDGDGEAHVIDFGLARVAGAERADGTSSGTPPFMAPELLRGGTPSVASDIFALGVTLWVLLRGDYPFGAGLSRPPKSEPPPVSGDSDAAVRAALEVARRAMCADPMDRLPTVEELVAALEEACPAARVEVRRVFVAPRPRGQAELLGRVEARLVGPDHASASRSRLLVGASGAGKTSLLRELKWRLQLRSRIVIDVALADLGPGAQFSSLLAQLSAAFASTEPGARAVERARSALSRPQFSEAELSDALGEAFLALGERGPVALLLDDIDRAESSFAAVLRSAIFAEASGVAVIATATDAEAPSVRALAADDRFEVPPLCEADVRALAMEALGSVDASVLDALCARVKGLPGALIDALAVLFELPAPTVADVEALPTAGVSLSRVRSQLAPLSSDALRLLGVLSLLGRVEGERAPAMLAGWLGGTDESQATRLLAECERAGLVSRRAEGLGVAEPVLARAVEEQLGAATMEALSRTLLADEGLAATMALPERARLAARARDEALVRELSGAAAELLLSRGAPAAAARVCEAWLEVAPQASRGEALISLARACQGLGEYERAAELANRAAGEPGVDGDKRADAAILAARALTALGRFEDAIECLSLVPDDVSGAVQARRFHELGKVHLRRGDYAAVAEAAEQGLAVAGPEDPVRAELLCSRGMVASYRAEHEIAREFHEEALELSRKLGSPRDEANALAYLAIGHFRAGDVLSARDMFSQCLEIARRMGDVGSMAVYALNLGAMLFCLGEPQVAAEHYESATRLAKRAGRSSTSLFARNNLALVHIYFGLYERARVEVSAVLADAQAAGQRYNEAQAIVLLGDLAARAEDLDQALIHYDDAIARYGALGQTREVADHHLDAAEALLDRAGPADASAAAARLSAAREPIEREGFEDLRLRLSLLLARARVASGDADGALGAFEDVIERARKARNRDVEWSALSGTALAHEALGADFAARRFNRLAVEVLEDIALRIPREYREAFWHDPRRRAARARAVASEESSHGRPLTEHTGSWLGDPRGERLLEIIKRLAGEHDLDRLLERITESAVDLSGAERGYVILVDRDGQLEKRTMQVAKSGKPDPHEAFSRSIAEAVLIDGEPIVTVDATDDGRLSEYVSVHKLMLRSVACLPIRGRSGTVGVLYLEHRRSRGRFSDSAVDLLHAFADQAAIALENARLLAENRRRQEELEQANAQLARAKQEVEELLVARTEELEEARRELKHTRRSRRDASMRHGMVGQSAAMRRVFDAIDRLQSVRVPVVIHGESGTGKELVARAIHYGGERAKAPFVALNCGSVPESLLESELFGHVKGAFSGADRERGGMIARASGGTLFLDEVGDMPMKMQVDLLRVLQEGTVCKVGGDQEERVDVRVLAASNKRLDELVKSGQFREDLFYRLNVVEISLPPLRERVEDIPLLCQHLLSGFAERDGLEEKRLTREALEHLMRLPLPGNVRQLEHLLLQAWVLVDGPVIDREHLAIETAREPANVPSVPAEPTETVAGPPENLGHHREHERRRILEALEAHNWNRARAAQELGMPRRTFYRRLREYSILVGADA